MDEQQMRDAAGDHLPSRAKLEKKGVQTTRGIPLIGRPQKHSAVFVLLDKRYRVTTDANGKLLKVELWFVDLTKKSDITQIYPSGPSKQKRGQASPGKPKKGNRPPH